MTKFNGPKDFQGAEFKLRAPSVSDLIQILGLLDPSTQILVPPSCADLHANDESEERPPINGLTVMVFRDGAGVFLDSSCAEHGGVE